MLPRGFRSHLGRSHLGIALLTVVGVSASLSTVLWLGSGVTAAPIFPAAQPTTDQDKKDPGDVVVDTESQKPDSTKPDSSSSPSTLAGTRFSCQSTNGQYTVMYNPESQPGKFYPWANPSTMGGGWTPERRCGEISRRLESYRPDGLLEMQTGVENGYNVVCVTTQKVPGCRIVLTVPPGQDPTAIRNRVFENLTVADNGRQTEAVNTFVEGKNNDILGQVGGLLNGLPKDSSSRSGFSSGIDLRPFLDKKDGGTGVYLRGGMPNRPGLRMNPDRFR